MHVPTSFGLASLGGFGFVSLGLTFASPGVWCSHLISGFVVFLFLPVVMAGSMFLVSVPLCVVIGAIGLLFSWGRPSGAPELILDVLALPARVVPSYIRALRRVESPRVWGFVLGSFVGTLSLIVWILQTNLIPGT